MDNKIVLIRLLKEGHISEVEFKSLYDSIVESKVVTVESGGFQHIVWPREYPQQPMPIYTLPDDVIPLVWHGTNHPTTGEPLGPTYSVTN